MDEVELRVRVWKQGRIDAHVEDADPLEVAGPDAFGEGDGAVTVHLDDDDSTVVAVGVTGAAKAWALPGAPTGRHARLDVTGWDLDYAEQVTAPVGGPGIVLNEFNEVLAEAGVSEPRLLTLEDCDGDTVEVLAASWFTPS